MCFILIYSRNFSGSTYACNQCEKSYKHKQSLSRHKRHECGKGAQFQCKIIGCNFKTKHKPNLKYHSLIIHGIPPSELHRFL